jgi:hypothetical protein
MRPIFIGGVGRCGSSVTAQCLLKHPDVEGQTGEFRWCRPEGFDHRNQPPSNTVEIPPLDLDYVREVANAHFATAKWWAEKSLENAAWFDMLLSVYPDAVCVYIYRHPMDNLAAVNDKARIHETEVTNRYWCATNLENAKRIRWVWERVWQQEAEGVRIFYLCLEELVSAPRHTMSTLCQFAGLDFRDNMVNPVDQRIALANRRFELTDEQRSEALPILLPVMRRAQYL